MPVQRRPVQWRGDVIEGRPRVDLGASVEEPCRRVALAIPARHDERESEDVRARRGALAHQAVVLLSLSHWVNLALLKREFV
jgi:hypothetical protein